MTSKEESSLNLNRFELLEKIGKGSFGLVYKAREKGRKTIYAAKITHQPLDEEENPKDIIRNLVREVNIICKINHPSIIKFIGFSQNDFEGNFRPVLITEYVPNGSLSNLIEQERKGLSNRKYDSTRKLIIIYGIASAMSYLHSHDIIHRDLKPDNILIDENMNPKIADFGLSKINHENNMSTASTKGIKGTLVYIPPETFDDWEYTKEGDVYAFGMIVYEIMTTERPFNNCTFREFIEKVTTGKHPRIDISVPQSYRSLIEMCWAQKVSERPSFEKIVNDLRNESGFITETIDEGEFISYVEFVEECETKYESKKHILKIDEFNNDKNANKKQHGESEKYYQQYLRYYHGKGVPVDMKKASHYCKLAADKGHIKSMFNFGFMLERGRGVSKNEEEACRYYKMAADKGHVKAMLNYGFMLSEGLGIPKNEEEACRYYKIAADKGQIDAMINYGVMLSEGRGVSKNEEEACRYFKMAADKGDVDIMNNYGNMLSEGRGVSKNEEEACRYYKIAADKGHIDAMYNYGLMLSEGRGVSINNKEACKYYKMAADKGQIDAMNNYGLMLTEGLGISKNEEEACKYYKMAADKGDISAMFNYSLMLSKGRGVPINDQKACKYYKMAADKGHVKAMFNYGVMLSKGRGVSINEEEACRYYKMAADKGDISAMYNYGNMLSKGNGVPKNKKEACRYFKMAADKGDLKAKNRYTQISKL